MGFTLYQAGSGAKNCKELIRKNNCNQLLSQLNERSAIKDWVDYLRSHPECTSKLFIDSGAFSAHTKGAEVDVDDYIEYINSIDDAVYIFAQVDKIPGRFGQPKTPQELAEAPELSWENYLYMVDKVKSRDKLLPIFHQGEDFKWLHNMLNYTHPDGSHIWYIGISPANDVSVVEKQKWIEKVFKIIKESPNPNVKTHAFGMTSLDLLERYPFTSADSTSWIQHAAYGSVIINGKAYCVSERSEIKDNHISNRSPVISEEIDKKARQFGYTLDDLKKEDSARCAFNLLSLKEWADNYQSRENNLFKKDLW